MTVNSSHVTVNGDTCVNKPKGVISLANVSTQPTCAAFPPGRLDCGYSSSEDYPIPTPEMATNTLVYFEVFHQRPAHVSLEVSLPAINGGDCARPALARA